MTSRPEGNAARGRHHLHSAATSGTFAARRLSDDTRVSDTGDMLVAASARSLVSAGQVSTSLATGQRHTKGRKV